MAANPALAISPVLDAVLDQVRIDAGGRSGAIGDLQIEAANRHEFRARLARILYCRWHLRTTAPDDEHIQSRRDLTLEQGLTAAVPHAFTMASGRLTGSDPARPDQLLVDRSGVRTWVPAHAVCTPGPFTAGQTLSLLVPPVRPMLCPGFFLADGARGTAPDGRLRRVYLHIRDAGDAVTTWRAALQVLESRETRYRAKVVSASPLPERADGMTVYLDRDDTITIAGLAGLDRGSRPRPVSIFAEQVGNGIATADEPDDPRPGMSDLSFGEHRARVIADSLTWHAITRASPREAAVVTALLEAGIDPANPARNTSRPTHEKELSDDHHRTRVRIRPVHQRRRIRHRITGHGAAEHHHHRHRQGLTARPRCGAEPPHLGAGTSRQSARTDKDIMNKRIRIPLTLAISALAAICIPLATTTSAHAVEPSAVEASAPHDVPVPPGWWFHGPITLSVKASKRCLDADTTGGGVNGNKVQIWDCNDMNQQWWDVYEEGSSDVFVFVNVKYNRCLDQATQSYAQNGGKVQLWDCNFLVQQQWTYDSPSFPASTGWYPIRMNGASGVVLDADANGGYANGDKVQVYAFLNRDNQEWHSWPAG